MASERPVHLPEYGVVCLTALVEARLAVETPLARKFVGQLLALSHIGR
ncbi:MAG: hypothetical protein RMK65_06535 [Anaerolineae bacterium]|nr:hypothetical protein [Anaerolineae bacterium]MCX8066368.1 hypothetical protein [Anaerolineae bacterium]MDW7991781.1 hypothetical protein [Anaerolineae bacterium]